MMESVLIAAPTSDAKDYCVDDWIKQVRSLVWPNCDILLIDNSGDSSHYKQLQKKGVKTLTIDPIGKPAVQFITESQNFIRHFFLNAGKWTHLFMLETDNFIPPNTLEHLLGFQVPVINLTYFYKDGVETSLCLQAITTSAKHAASFALTHEPAVGIIKGTCKDMRNIKLGSDVVLMAAGLGCTLIQRSVMEKVEFRYDKSMPGIFSDSYFHLDLLTNNIPNYLDTMFLTEHRRMSWQGNPDLKKAVI